MDFNLKVLILLPLVSSEQPLKGLGHQRGFKYLTQKLTDLGLNKEGGWLRFFYGLLRFYRKIKIFLLINKEFNMFFAFNVKLGWLDNVSGVP
jgi:hypothetical protein